MKIMSFLSNGASKEKSDFIWELAELLRGPYKKDHYGDVILPLCVLRRFDCVLKETKEAVLEKNDELKKSKIENRDPILNKISGYNFNNTSKYDFLKLLADPNNIIANLRNYIAGFSKNVREIFENFKFNKEITALDKSDLLYLILQEFNKVDLHPDKVFNYQMGLIFEDLIRRFSENAEAGDHFTPREVIRLMVNILFNEDKDILTQEGLITTIFDPACGTGGMLSVSENYIRELNPDAQVELFGQDFNPQSYAICKSDMLIKGQDAAHIVFGDSLKKSEDGHKGRSFRYMLANPPFGVQWKKQQKEVKEEHEKEGFNGRFGAGLPKISDGSLLFLLHMISKMKNNDEGSRIAIIFNASPSFTGNAGSGESEIRKYIIENDLLEGIIALPEQMFYNTGIFTYIWILTNRKNEDSKNGPIRKGKVQLVNTVDFYEKMKKSLGNKRNYISEEKITEITKIYGEFKENECCKIFYNKDFGYRKITVERPLRLNFKITQERIKKIQNENGFQNLVKLRKKGEAGKREVEEGRRIQEEIVNILRNQKNPNRVDLTAFLNDNKKVGDKIFNNIYKNREEFIGDLKALFKTSGLEINSSLFKVVVKSISEKDETADICVDSQGNPESDTDLRDYENVPLKEDIKEYFKREVKPYVPDAWIDESRTKIGYEIPLTRYFYKFKLLRQSKEIMEDIKNLEKEIQNNLEKMMSD